MVSIDGIEVRLVNIKAPKIAFDMDGKAFKYVDKDGKQVKKVPKPKVADVWKYVDDEGKPVADFEGTHYKSKDGKPVGEFKATTAVAGQKFDLREMGYLVTNTHTYMVVSEHLKERLKELASEGKGLSFKYIGTSRGHQAYRAVVYYDIELDRSLMRLFSGDIRKNDLDEDTEAKEITADPDVETLDLDDLEV